VVLLVSEFLPGLPQLFRNQSSYGKLLEGHDKKEKSSVQLFQVPKRWFLHFYGAGVVVNGFALMTVIRLYLFHIPLPSWIQATLDFVDRGHQISTDGLAVVILVMLMLIQDSRRLYECMYVSVYSKGSMHLIHYVSGIIVYTTFFLVLLVEAPHSMQYLNQRENVLSHLSWRHVAGVILFAWASVHHHNVHQQFASFRRSDKGDVVTLKHVMPHGGWFELLSTPHFFMEILIYISYILIGGFRHVTLWSLVIFVLTNQISLGIATHRWYKKEFKNYPANRKAIIPYIL